MAETTNDRQHRIAVERFEEWLVGQVAAWIADTYLHVGNLPGYDIKSLADAARQRNADQDWTFDGPTTFRTWPQLTHIERESYTRYSGIWLEPTNLERAIEQGRALVRELTA